MDSTGTNKHTDQAKIALSVTRALRRRKEREQEIFHLQRRQGQFNSVANVSLPRLQSTSTPSSENATPGIQQTPTSRVPRFQRYGAMDPSVTFSTEEKFNTREKKEEEENIYNSIPPTNEVAHVQFDTPDDLTPDEALIERIRQENNLEELASNLTNELIVQSQEQSVSAYWRSVTFKTFDGMLRLLIIMMGIVVGILGNNIHQDNINNTITLIVTIFGFVIPGISEFREQFAFKDRSVVLRKCYQDFNQITQDLRILEVSGKDTLEIIDELTKVRVKLDDIDMEAFNSQIVRLGEPRAFKTAKASTEPSPVQVRNVVRPNDIPILPTQNEPQKLIINKTPTTRQLDDNPVSPYRLGEVAEDVSVNMDDD